MSAGRWLETDGVRWLFDAGSDSLDFTSGSEEQMVGWLAERFERLFPDHLSPEHLVERERVDALALRAAIARLAAASADREPLDPDDIDMVNLFAATPDVPPVLAGGRRQAGAGRIRIGQALSTLARDAVALFAVDGERIRRCADDSCRMVFRDESRTGTRRWCSMSRCGNRAKVRAFRARVSTGTTQYN